MSNVSLFLTDRITSETYTEFAEYLAVNFAEHYSGMDLTSVKFRQLLKGAAAVFILDAEH